MRCAKRDGVGGLLGKVDQQRAIEILGSGDGLVVAFAQSGVGDEVRHLVAERDPEALPFDREHSMALQVAECAVVRDEFEAVLGPLEGAAGPVAAIPALAHVRLQQCDPVFVAEAPDPVGGLALRAAEVREAGRHQDFLLAIGIEIEQCDLRPPLHRPMAGPSGPSSGHRRDTTAAVCCAGRAEIGRPFATPLRGVDALQERGDHLAQLDEHHVGVLARLGQGVRAHAQQQLLVGLAGAVDADVGEGCRRQEPA